MTGETSENTLRYCCEENWRHIRHVETLRMKMFHVMIVAILAVIFFVETYANEILAINILFFSSIVFIANIIITIKWNITFDKHMKCVKEIVDKIADKKFLNYTFYKSTPEKLMFHRTGNIYILIYSVITFFLFYRLNYFYNTLITPLILGSILLSLMILSLIYYFIQDAKAKNNSKSNKSLNLN